MKLIISNSKRISFGLILLLCACIFLNKVQAQTCENVEDYHLFASDSSIDFKYITVDNEFNKYVLGSYSGADSLGGIPLPKLSTNRYSYFVAKFNSNNQIQWLRPILQSPLSMAPMNGIKLDATGNVLVYGAVGEYLQVDNQTITDNSNSIYSGLIIKFNPTTGNYIQHFLIENKNSVGNNNSESVVYDLQIYDNAYFLAILFEDSIQIGNTAFKANDYVVSSSPSWGKNSIVAKLNMNFGLEWASQIKNGFNDTRSITVNAAGVFAHTYISTKFLGDSTRFGNSILPIGNATSASVISLLNASTGAFEWSRIFQTRYGSALNIVSSGPNQNTCYIAFESDTFRFNNNLIGTAQQRKLFVAKVDATSALSQVYVHSIARAGLNSFTLYTDDANNCYISQSIGNTAPMYVLKLNSNLDLLSKQEIRLTHGNPNLGTALTSLYYKNGRIYFVGKLGNTGVHFGKFFTARRANFFTRAFYGYLESGTLSIENKNPIQLNQGSSVDVVMNIQGYSRVKWSPKIGISSDSTASTRLNPSTNMLYTIKAFNACGDSVETNLTVNVVTTGIGTNHAEIKVYPNPNQGKIIIEQSLQKNLEMRVYSVLGQLLFETKLNAMRNEITLDLNSGTYILEIDGRKQKIMIQ